VRQLDSALALAVMRNTDAGLAVKNDSKM